MQVFHPDDDDEPSGSLVDMVTDRLEQWILDGTLPLGSKLKEQAIADKLGVSRGPLREAVRALEGRKLVVRETNRGAWVTKISAEMLDDVLIMREALEGMACRLAARNATDDDLEQLERLSRNELHGATIASFQDDLAFHRRILSIAGNSSIANALNGELYYLFKVYRLKSKTVPGRAEEARREHRDIVRAMRDRDPELAEMLMRRHIRNWRRNIVEVIATEPETPDAPAAVTRRGRAPA